MIKPTALATKYLNDDALKASSVTSLAWFVGLYAALLLNTSLLTIADWPYALIGWPAGGILLWGLWTLGHDTLHGAASKHRLLNNVIGWTSFLATWHPWHATKALHDKHHTYLSDAGRDTAWNPWTTEAYAQKSRFVQRVYRLMRQSLWWLGTTLFLQRHYQFSTVSRQRRGKHALNLLLIAATVALQVHWAWHNDASFVYVFGVPYLVFSAIFSTVTLLHHSSFNEQGAALPWYSGKTGRSDPQHHTIDYDLPMVAEYLLFRGNLHTLHHLNARIPFYKWRLAREKIDSLLPDYVQRRTFRPSLLLQVLSTYQLYSDQLNNLTRFDYDEETISCKSDASSPAPLAALDKPLLSS